MLGHAIESLLSCDELTRPPMTQVQSSTKNLHRESLVYDKYNLLQVIDFKSMQVASNQHHVSHPLRYEIFPLCSARSSCDA